MNVHILDRNGKRNKRISNEFTKALQLTKIKTFITQYQLRLCLRNIHSK